MGIRKVVVRALLNQWLIVISFSAIPAIVFGQSDCMENKNMQLHNNSFQCKWVYYKVKDSVDGVVVKFEKQRAPCGMSAMASLAIVSIGTDTIRVLDMCNDSVYKRGERIRILPDEVPKYSVDIPFYYDVVDEKENKYYSRSNEYDERILKTTWGDIKRR